MKKKIIATLLLIISAVTLIGTHKAAADSYTYSIWSEPVSAPDAYEWERTVRAEDLGIDAITAISDVYYKNGHIFIAMNGKIVITDEEFNTETVITEYKKGSETVPISAPKCIFVTADNEIYITEEAKGLIVQLTMDGKLVREIGDPHIKSIQNITYAPTKVVVDNIGRIYVKAKSVYEGIIELDPYGNYSRFIGANEVAPSLWDRFKRLISTEEQIAQMQLWLPTDYSDITLDPEGYIFATVRDNSAPISVKKLNSAGTNVINVYEYIALPAGDYKRAGGTNSTLTNIAVSADGRFALLDANMARVFVYSSDGLLLYVVGGSGKQNGQLNSPVDLTFMGDRIIVADLVTCSLEIFKPTEYGKLINTALYWQSRYDYEQSGKYWQQVYDINSSLIAANMGLGLSELRAGEYEKAMVNFERTGERKSWSAAFERVREKWLEDHLGTAIIVIILIIIAIEVLKRVIRKLNAKGVFEGKRWVEILRRIRYTAFTWPKFMMGSPFKAFDEVKYEDAGSTTFAVIIMLLYSWMALIKGRYTGFLLNFNDIEHFNIPIILISSVCPFLIFVVANWAVGVLMDGKGNFRNVFKYTMYSLYPQIFCNLLGILLSRVCIYEETGIVRALFGIGWFLTIFYMFVGLVTIHQYSFTKGIANVLVTAVGMAVVIFIILLFASLVSNFANDIGTIVDEFKIYI